MAIALQGTPSVYEGASVTSAVIPYPAGVTAGEVLVAAVTISAATATTDTPSGWTLAKAQNGPSSTPSVSVYYKVATGSESGSLTIATGAAAGKTTGTMSRWSGVDNSTPMDAAAVSANSGIAATFTMPSITTATNGAMLVHVISLNASDSATNDIVPLSGTTEFATSTNVGRLQVSTYEERATAGATGTRVWSKTNPGTTLQWAGVTLALRSGSSGPVAPALVQRVVGIPDTNTSTSARVQVKVTNATSARLKCSTDSAGTTGVVWGSAATPDSDGNATLTATGLTANTRYYYRVEMTDSAAGTSLDTGNIGRLKTAPVGQANFAFDFGSCTNASDSDSMAAIAARGDDLFFHLGDLFYHDASGTDLANFRTRMNAKITATNHAAVFSTMNMTYSPSDHDAMNNNGTAGDDPTGWANWNTVKNELFPMPANYYSFVWGRVRFIQTDTRSYKSPAGNTDNSSKTALGSTQKAWLKSQIDSATEPVIVVIQSDPWVIGTDPGDDGWGGYITERNEMASYYDASNKNIVILAGDMHAVAADDGTNAPGGVTVFQAAPLNNNASIKGGPYTQGPYPSSGTSVVQQYGRVVVTDSGSNIDLAFTGYSSDNTSRVTLTKSFTAPSDVTVAPSGIAGGSVLGSPTLTAPATLAPAGITGGSVLGSPALTASATIAPAGIATGQALGAPTLSGATTVAPGGISTGEAVGTPALSTGSSVEYNLFTETPSIVADQDTGSVNLGTEFYVTEACNVTQVRYLEPSSGAESAGTVVMSIYSTTDGVNNARVAGPFTVPRGTPGTWAVYTLPTPFALTPNTRYRVVSRHPLGKYAATGGYFTDGAGASTLTQGPVVRPNVTDALGNDQGSYQYDDFDAFPQTSFNGANYWSDVTISVSSEGTTVSPTGIASSKALGSPTVSTTATLAPAGIATAAAVGTPTLTLDAPVAPAGIASGAALGAPTLTTTVTVAPSGITTRAAVGAPAMGIDITVAPSGIATKAAVGSPTLEANFAAMPTGIPSAVAVGTPALSGTTTVSPAGIASREAFGTLSAGLFSVIAPTGIPTKKFVGQPLLASSSAVGPTGIPSGVAFGEVAILGGGEFKTNYEVSIGKKRWKGRLG